MLQHGKSQGVFPFTAGYSRGPGGVEVLQQKQSRYCIKAPESLVSDHIQVWSTSTVALLKGIVHFSEREEIIKMLGASEGSTRTGL